MIPQLESNPGPSIRNTVQVRREGPQFRRGSAWGSQEGLSLGWEMVRMLLGGRRVCPIWRARGGTGFGEARGRPFNVQGVTGRPQPWPWKPAGGRRQGLRSKSRLEVGPCPIAPGAPLGSEARALGRSWLSSGRTGLGSWEAQLGEERRQ